MSRRSPNLAKAHIKDAVKILITFAKSTELFGTMGKFKTLSKLSANQDAIFIGTLLLRLFGIFSVNYQEVIISNFIIKYYFFSIKLNIFHIRIFRSGNTIPSVKTSTTRKYVLQKDVATEHQ